MKHFLPTLILIGFFCGCGGNGATDETSQDGGGSNETSDAANPAPSAETQSETLLAEMRKMTAESLKAQSPDLPEAEIDSKVDAMLGPELKKMQQLDPGFLMVTSAQEAELKAGKSYSDVAAKVDAALKKFEEFGMELPGLTKKLVADYKAGTLSPVRSELLIQMLNVADKKLQHDIQ